MYLTLISVAEPDDLLPEILDANLAIVWSDVVLAQDQVEGLSYKFVNTHGVPLAVGVCA